MQTIPLFQSPPILCGFNRPYYPIELVKPLYEKSTQADYDSLDYHDGHDGHDYTLDSSHLLYLLVEPEIFEVSP